jgi:branched-chain amino acid transport system permease protein
MAVELQELLLLFFRGLTVGAMYAVVASGLTIVFGVMDIINIAHGEFLMLGGYVTVLLATEFGMNPLLTIPIATLVLFVVGLGIHWALIERIIHRRANETSSLILTFGLSIILVNLALITFSADFRGLAYLSSSVQLLGGGISQIELVTFGISLVVLALLWAFLQRSRFGQALRATSQNADVAQACGINIKNVRMLTFGIGAALAAISGSLVTMTATLHPSVGFHYVLIAFAIVILGGLGSVPGAFIGAFLLGVFEVFVVAWISPAASTALLFALIFAVLLVKPTGILGEAEAI